MFNRDGISVKFDVPDEFTPVKTFKYPLVFGLQDGEVHLFWLEEEDQRDKLAKALRASEVKNQEPLPGHKYVIRETKNSFVTSIFRALQPSNEDEDDPRIVKGTLGRAVNKHGDMFQDQYVILDTGTGIINFYTDPYASCLEEHELRFCKAITDLDRDKDAV